MPPSRFPDAQTNKLIDDYTAKIYFPTLVPVEPREEKLSRTFTVINAV